MEDEKKLLVNQDYDSILDRIGFGQYQWILVMVVGCGLYVDGIETVLMSLLSFIFMDLWDLSAAAVSLHPSAVFLGKCIGISISGVYGDDYGRLGMIKICLICVMTSYCLAPVMPEFYSFVCSRFLTGIGVGFVMPVFAAYLMENFPTKQKVVGIAAIMFVLPLGELVAILCFFALSPNLDNHNWRYIFPILGGYIVLATVLAYIYLKESPLFLLKQGQIIESAETLNYMAVRNKKPMLSHQEVDVLHSAMISGGEKGLMKIKLIFSPQYSRVTSLLLVLWYCTQIIYFGFFIILPVTLSFGGSNSAVLIGWMIAALVQMPFHVLNSFAAPRLGTRNMLLASTGGLILFEALSVFLIGSSLFILCVVGLTGCGVILFSTVFAYTAEIYDSSIRSMATGFFNIVCNLCGIATPLIIFRLNEMSPSLPYVFMGILAILAFISSFLLPRTDTYTPSKPANEV